MANRFTPGNVFWRGDWEYCPEYNIGDLVLRGGLFFLAIEHSAGEDPLDPLSVGYWLEFGGGPGPVAELLWTGTTINVTFARVATRTDLPITLIPGRLYYIADEGVVLLDMGNAAEEYGGNHGMQYYRGAFTTEADLIYAHPTDIEGAYAVVFATNTFWIWKDDRWLDTGTTATDLGIPPGGEMGQVLKKKSNADGDVGWADESGDSGGGHIIQDEYGTDMPQQSKLQFLGFDVTDDPINGRTVVSKSDRPQKPQNLSPYDGENGVYQFATFIGTNYVQPEGIPMGAMRLQIAIDIDFTDIIVDRTENHSSVSIMLDGTELAANEAQYYWRIQYATAEGIWSLWSDPTAFTTEMAFSPNVILTPMILAPTEEGFASAVNALLLSTNFAQIGESTLHESSSWKVNTRRDATGTDLWSKTDSTIDLISAMVDVDLTSVPPDQKVYAGVKYRGRNGAESRWSPFVGFYRRPYYESPVIGLELNKVSAAASVGRYISEDGDYVTLRSTYFDTHPIYAQIPNLVQDELGNHFSLIPPVFCRVLRISDNVIRFWISPNERPLFKLHPAFRRSPAGFLRGRYYSGSSIASAPGVTLAWAQIASWINSIATLNTTGLLYHASTVYEDALIKLLMNIEAGSVRIGDKFGKATDNAPGSGDVSNMASFPVWRGLYNEYSSSQTNKVCMGVSAINPARQDNAVFTVALSTPEDPLSTPVLMPSLTWTYPGTIPSATLGAPNIRSGYSDIVGDDLSLLFIGYGQTDVSAGGTCGPFGGYFEERGGNAVHGLQTTNNGGNGVTISGTGLNYYVRLSKWIA